MKLIRVIYWEQQAFTFTKYTLSNSKHSFAQEDYIAFKTSWKAFLVNMIFCLHTAMHYILMEMACKIQYTQLPFIINGNVLMDNRWQFGMVIRYSIYKNLAVQISSNRLRQNSRFSGFQLEHYFFFSPILMKCSTFIIILSNTVTFYWTVMPIQSINQTENPNTLIYSKEHWNVVLRKWIRFCSIRSKSLFLFCLFHLTHSQSIWNNKTT